MVGSCLAHKNWTRSEVTDTYTLAYYGKEFNTVVKRFIVQDPWVVKRFIVQDPWSLSYKPILEKNLRTFFCKLDSLTSVDGNILQ